MVERSLSLKKAIRSTLPCSVSKTDFMIFSPHGSDKDSIRLTLNVIQLIQVSCKKLLGIFIDEKSKFKEHIHYLRTSSINRLNLFRSLSSKGVDRANLLHLHKVFVRSNIKYGSQVYNSCHPDLKSKLVVVQNTALRVATNLPYGTANAALQVVCDNLASSIVMGLPPF